MKNIGIDISQIAHKGSGVSRYLENLVTALMRYGSANRFFFFFSSLRGDIPENVIQMIKPPHRLISWRLPPAVFEPAGNILRFPAVEKLVGETDVFVTSDWVEYPAIKAKKATVIHDLMLYKYPETLPQSIISVQKRRLEWVRKESSLILCDSTATKEDVIRHLHIPAEKLKMVYPGIPLPNAVIRSDNRQQVAAGNYSIPFILTVGKLEPRKNILKLVEAFAAARLENYQLLIAGISGWGDLITKIQLLKPDSVKLLGYVSDDQLRQLYQKASFFVYPSLYEGFGYPVAEAMSFGCPVAVSGSSSLAEIVQGYGMLFDPLSVEDMTSKLQLLARNNDLRRELSIKSLTRAADFSLQAFSSNFMSAIDTL